MGIYKTFAKLNYHDTKAVENVIYSKLKDKLSTIFSNKTISETIVCKKENCKIGDKCIDCLIDNLK